MIHQKTQKIRGYSRRDLIVPQTLGGRKILITRSRRQAEEFVRVVERAGGVAVVFPTIEIEPLESWDQCDRSIESLYMCNGIIFTSSNAVDFFFKRFREIQRDIRELEGKAIYAVGHKTKERLDGLGIKVRAIPQTYTSADLAKLMEQEDLRGKSFLFPTGNLTKETLADNLRLLGAHVDAIHVYRTVIPSQPAIGALDAQIINDGIDVLTFLSPSAFQNFVTLFTSPRVRLFSEHALIAAIGPTTSRAIEQAGLEVQIVPEQSTTESLIDAIANYFRVHQTNS